MRISSAPLAVITLPYHGRPCCRQDLSLLNFGRASYILRVQPQRFRKLSARFILCLSSIRYAVVFTIMSISVAATPSSPEVSAAPPPRRFWGTLSSRYRGYRGGESAGVTCGDGGVASTALTGRRLPI